MLNRQTPIYGVHSTVGHISPHSWEERVQLFLQVTDVALHFTRFYQAFLVTLGARCTVLAGQSAMAFRA
jgi:hypothetical protein